MLLERLRVTQCYATSPPQSVWLDNHRRCADRARPGAADNLGSNSGIGAKPPATVSPPGTAPASPPAQPPIRRPRSAACTSATSATARPTSATALSGATIRRGDQDITLGTGGTSLTRVHYGSLGGSAPAANIAPAAADPCWLRRAGQSAPALRLHPARQRRGQSRGAAAAATTPTGPTACWVPPSTWAPSRSTPSSATASTDRPARTVRSFAPRRFSNPAGGLHEGAPAIQLRRRAPAGEDRTCCRALRPGSPWRPCGCWRGLRGQHDPRDHPRRTTPIPRTNRYGLLTAQALKSAFDGVDRDCDAPTRAAPTPSSSTRPARSSSTASCPGPWRWLPAQVPQRHHTGHPQPGHRRRQRSQRGAELRRRAQRPASSTRPSAGFTDRARVANCTMALAR